MVVPCTAPQSPRFHVPFPRRLTRNHKLRFGRRRRFVISRHLAHTHLQVAHSVAKSRSSGSRITPSSSTKRTTCDPYGKIQNLDMPHRPLRRSQLIEYTDAAAGHPGVLSDKSGAMFVKPCKKAEIEFYESAAAHPDFQYYIPTFYGTLEMNQDAAGTPHPVLNRPTHGHSSSQSGLLEPANASVATSVPIPVSEAPWTPSAGRGIVAETAAVLMNVTNGYVKPNILDVKLGARLWADDAPQAKRQKLDKISDETTSGSMGFRIAGMKVWAGEGPGSDARVSSDGYVKYDKDYGRTLGIESVHEGFKEYFFVESTGVTRRLARKVINRFLMDLRGLVEVLEKEESRMYSSSLLFVYEGDGKVLAEKFETEKIMMESLHDDSGGGGGTEADDSSVRNIPVIAAPVEVQAPEPEGGGKGKATSPTSEEEEEEEIVLPNIQALKMIDFAHAAWTPGQGPDENVLRGIRSVIRILEDLLGK